MTFKKLYIKEVKGLNTAELSTSSSYLISLKPTDGYDVYFTDATGLQIVTNGLLNKVLKFSELPKPLLKQIK
jgi:hypothetical protein